MMPDVTEWQPVLSLYTYKMKRMGWRWGGVYWGGMEGCKGGGFLQGLWWGGVEKGMGVMELFYCQYIYKSSSPWYIR